MVGHRSNARPAQLIGDVCNYDVVDMINDQEKNKIVNRLYQILRSLRDQVVEKEVYLFSRRRDQRTGQRQLYLYKVALQDKQQLTFITQQMLDHLSGNNETRRQTSRKRKNREMENVTTDDSNTDNDDDDYIYRANVIRESRLSKMNRLNEKKKTNVSLRREENQRKRIN